MAEEVVCKKAPCDPVPRCVPISELSTDVQSTRGVM